MCSKIYYVLSVHESSIEYSSLLRYQYARDVQWNFSIELKFQCITHESDNVTVLGNPFIRHSVNRG
jgi:hypothetical protein